MPYQIDGHNLIPKLGLNLQNADDELELVTRLQIFCRVARKQAEVYFDGAPAGQVGTRKFGPIAAHFVRLGQTADDAIGARLKSLGRAARNWTVVTSDHQVQADARNAGATVLSSEAFAGQVIESMRAPGAVSTREGKMSAEEVEEWMKLFRENKR
ncbi:MAG: NYN domain-containing protein [Chloroflexota bacterium]